MAGLIHGGFRYAVGTVRPRESQLPSNLSETMTSFFHEMFSGVSALDESLASLFCLFS